MEKVKILKKFDAKNENILLLLHALQKANPRNYLTEEDLRLVANYLSLPLGNVMGVATFYSLFSLKPRGKYIIRVCDSPPCHLEGSESILEEIKKYLSLEVGQTTRDGIFTLETSECLGHCAESPVMMINEEVHGNLTAEKVRSILDKLRRAK